MSLARQFRETRIGDFEHMKNLAIAILSFIPFLAPLQVFAQDTIWAIAYTPTAFQYLFFDDRDTSNYFFIDTSQAGNIWQIGTPSKTIFDSAYSVPLAMVTDTFSNCPANNVSSFSFVLKTDDYTMISYIHKIHADSGMDGGILEYSYDGGANWNNIVNSPWNLTDYYSNTDTIASAGQPGFTGSSGWVKSVIQNYGFDFVRFRFTFFSDSLNSLTEGWMIDNLEIICLGTSRELGSAGQGIELVPNPAREEITVVAGIGVEILSVSIRDMAGREVLRTNQSVFDISELMNGPFLTVIETKAGSVARRLVKF